MALKMGNWWFRMVESVHNHQLNKQKTTDPSEAENNVVDNYTRDQQNTIWNDSKTKKCGVESFLI